MRVIRTVVACLAAALALTAAGAGVASAEEYPLTGLPELGRCVKVALGTGHFNRGNCVGTDKDGNDGEFEWKPGPGEHGTFKIRLSSVNFETVGHTKINCTLGFLTGEYTNGKDVKISKVTLQGCVDVNTNAACSSSPIEKGVIESSQQLAGEIGFLPNPKNESNPYVGLELRAEPESVPMLSFTCGESLSSILVAVEGSVIGRILKVNKMLAEDGLVYQQKEGHQKYEAFKGGVNDTLTFTFTPVTNPIERHSEAAALGTAGAIANEEAIEFKSKQR
jgi:hypothetical protein